MYPPQNVQHQFAYPQMAVYSRGVEVQQQMQQVQVQNQQQVQTSQQQNQTQPGQPSPPDKPTSPVSGAAPGIRPRLTVQIPLGDQSQDGQAAPFEETQEEQDGYVSTQEPKNDLTSRQEPATKPSDQPESRAGPAAGPVANDSVPSSGPNLPPPPRFQLVPGGGEQTPLSAALPSRLVNDLLPSPSNFYSNDWGFEVSFPQANTAAQRGLNLEMLPSPLQFSMPVLSASMQSLSDARSETGRGSGLSTVTSASDLGSAAGVKRQSSETPVFDKRPRRS